MPASAPDGYSTFRATGGAINASTRLSPKRGFRKRSRSMRPGTRLPRQLPFRRVSPSKQSVNYWDIKHTHNADLCEYHPFAYQRRDGTPVKTYQLAVPRLDAVGHAERVGKALLSHFFHPLHPLPAGENPEINKKRSEMAIANCNRHRPYTRKIVSRQPQFER